MIKLKNLIPKNLNDPFTGELYEGLIQTINVDKALDIVLNHFENLPESDIINDGDSIIVGFKPNYTEDKIKNYIGNYPDPNISKILVLLNNLGYFPSMVKYELNNRGEQYDIKYNPSKFRDLILNEEPTYLIFFFEAKYDPIINPPQFIYHITDSKYIDSIKKIGLKPKSLNKRSNHSERIYFSLDENKSKVLWNNLKYDLPKGKGVLLVIDTINLNNTFYKDPNFKNMGIYTYENIPPQNIIKYEPITEN